MPELQELAYREAETTGSLLLTTSLRPGSPEPYVRSHASAAAHIRMRTLSLFELGLSNASVSRKKVRNGGQLQDPAFCAVILAGTNRPRRDEATGTYVFPITAFGA